ncbi:MAG TPA: TOMM precursor leader peptide-binding protein [Nocardioides sp.]|uniref:TOMM precursor leader peptide-binding protein n=1 Tax=Nocardioides sp. TaxID=35761 RepID=UPI002D7E7A13|nr:TOMM precursor leader peptide-binding protein [Nocardioides sp.]HET6651260.1 TOMM precursor leader peptide-binding protein [Nocardioides sp.]
MRPLLVPGAHVLRRRDGSFQVGLDPRGAIVLPDTPAVASCLARLDGSKVRPADEAPAAVLAQAGLIVDERAVVPLLAGGDAGPVTARAASLLRRHGTRAPDVVAARSRRSIGVVEFGHPSGAGLLERLRGLLDEALLTCSSDEPAVGLLVGLGEPDRELVDGWMRERVPHLLVRLAEGRATVGPFVVPGATACLRCVDAHHTDADPTWPLLVRQYAEACRGPRRDGIPEPLDPLLATVAAGWAARDLATYVDGGRPSTWSTTLTLDADLTAVETRTWSRHPDCGCSWQ